MSQSFKNLRLITSEYIEDDIVNEPKIKEVDEPIIEKPSRFDELMREARENAEKEAIHHQIDLDEIVRENLEKQAKLDKIAEEDFINQTKVITKLIRIDDEIKNEPLIEINDKNETVITVFPHIEWDKTINNHE